MGCEITTQINMSSLMEVQTSESTPYMIMGVALVGLKSMISVFSALFNNSNFSLKSFLSSFFLIGAF